MGLEAPAVSCNLESLIFDQQRALPSWNLSLTKSRFFWADYGLSWSLNGTRS